jgi:hypothetical protein
VALTVENTGEKLAPQLVSTLGEPFQRGTERIRTDHAGVGLGLAIVNSITQAHDGTLTLDPRAAGGSASRCNYPPRHRTLTDERSGELPHAPESNSQGPWISVSCGVSVTACWFVGSFDEDAGLELRAGNLCFAAVGRRGSPA